MKHNGQRKKFFLVEEIIYTSLYNKTIKLNVKSFLMARLVKKVVEKDLDREEPLHKRVVKRSLSTTFFLKGYLVEP